MSAPVRLIYESKNFLAVNKPAGLLVHGTRTMEHETTHTPSSKFYGPGKEPTLVDWLLRRYPEIRNVGDNPQGRPGIVHRLDKATSGVVLVARNQNYFNYLKSLFQKRTIAKTYVALVHGKLKSRTGTVDTPIAIKRGSVKRTVHSGKMLKDAITDYTVVKYLNGEGGASYSLVEVRPRTGRTHQIRVHLSSIGHPVVGDVLYGGKARRKAQSVQRLMLHALSLEFTTRRGRRLKLEAEPPREFLDAVARLEG